MAKDPAFLFYPGDFMMGTMLLSMEEKGQYITLLSVMHQQGRLTNEEVEIVIKGKPSQKLASKFKIDDDGLWFNERLEVETEKRKRFTESRRNSLNIDNNDQVHIYILHDQDSGYFKIGSSKYPLLRLGEMQRKNPAIELYWKSERLVVRSVEKELHQEFRPKKIKNDWFSLTDDDLDLIFNKDYFRTDTNNHSRTEARTENENRDRNKDELKNKKESKNNSRETVPEQTGPKPLADDMFEPLTDEWFAYIFDEMEVERKKMAYRDHDIDDQLIKFKSKVRGSPADYIYRDTAGVRSAFDYHLRNTKPQKKYAGAQRTLTETSPDPGKDYTERF
jgi:hypothetical protein